ncbi:unnamed protein product, partial [Didymodactylos carnosus]
AENTQKGTTILFVDVHDTEYNDSVTVQFQTQYDNPFRIITSPGGGRVILDGQLKKEFYNLTILAYDRLNHTSYAQLLITVYDVNDHTPIIENCQQGIITSKVRENATINTPILKINATDEDRGLNGDILFSLKGGGGSGSNSENDGSGSNLGTESDLFGIDSETGLIYNKKRLKHLKSGHSEYTMTVFAQDRDPQNPRSTHCIIKINVEDINDHYPVITSPSRDNDLISIKVEKRVNYLNYAVLIIRAKDDDSGKNAHLSFSIKSKPECATSETHFTIDSSSGIISIRPTKLGDIFQTQNKYCLVIQVCDQGDEPKCVERKVNFQLSQDGFEPPVWAPETALTFQRVMKVVELAQQNIVIDTFKASISNDTTKKVIFEMEPVDWKCHNSPITNEAPRIPFLLAPDENGRNIARLVIYQPIDADPPTGCTHFTFKIKAKNSAMEALSVESQYKIEIIDSNDNIPIFNVSSYRGQIYENEIKENILRVQADDKDIDPKNRNTTYFIRCQNNAGSSQSNQVSYYSNNPLSNSLSCHGIVSIDPETGWISVQRQFDFDNPNDRRYVFDVFAKNILPSDRCNSNNKELQQHQQGGGADSNPTIQICVTEHRVPVIIEVLDRNDNAPVFQGKPYLTHVSEDAEPGTTIFQLNVSDVDTDDILTFNIVNVQEASAFAVKENTGEVYLASALDYERVQQHRVIIQVSDSNNEHTSQAELTVIVEDANDNPPRFLNLPATIEIEEGKQVIDYDQLMKQQNGNLYSDENYESQLYRQLKRRRRRRATSSRKYGKQNEGKHLLRKLQKTSDNTLTDVNRYRTTPSSPSSSYNQPLEYISRVIYTVKADDPDKGRPANVGGIKFMLTSSNQQYTDYFEIHPTNGTIHLKKDLDRDPPNGFDEWLLTIIAADEGGFEGSKKNASWLKILVKDINDNPPIFIDVDPIGHIAENARKDTRVEGLRIRATDYDKLSENTTRYALTLNTKSIDGQDVFRIDELTSDIYLNVDNYLDREKTPHHNLSIIARDIGDPAGNLQSKELKITIIIDDVNDQPPRFKPTQIQAQISEIAQRGDFVSEIKAEDDDIGVNTHSIYEIVEECQLFDEKQQRHTTIMRCSKPKHFIFKETSLAEKGTIILLEPVNYDPPDNQIKFLLKVKATNGGMSDYANVTVFITDFNDNTPVFSQSVYFVNISESTPFGSKILQVSATDNDVMPVNKEFIFRIPPDRQQYENRQHLRIDTMNGKIYLKKNFDREKSSTISLPLEAVNNQSTNVLIGRAMLVLNILDVNDNFPQFAENYQARIREYEQPKKILEFKATDPDEKSSTTNFEFKLGSKNVWPEDGEPKFRLDVTSDYYGPVGVLSTLKVLDREELCSSSTTMTKKGKPYCGKYYDLPIRMNDNSKPHSQSGINYLRVTVEDVNDNPHYNGQKQIDAYDYKQQLIKALNSAGLHGIYIGMVYSKDEDDWDIHTKQFELLTPSTEFFRVDKGGKTPGAIYLKTPTSNSTSQLEHITYTLIVSVTDTYDQWLQRDAQTSTVKFHLNDLSPEAVENAASIRLQDITAEEFIETRHMPAGQSYYKEFARLIGDIVNVHNIEIFSIQDHEYLPRTIDVYYAVHGSGYLSKIKINGLVNMKRTKLEDLFNISQIGINECLSSDAKCFEKGCISRSEIVTKQPYYVINANETAFIGLHIRSKAQCQCETDIQYQLSRELQEQKSNQYCLNGGYPQRDHNTMKCSCPHGTLYNGERCQLTTVSFDGNGGYGWYKPLSTCSQWLLQLEFLTQSPNGTLLYNGPLNNQLNQDYFSLQLVNGHPSIELNFGTKAIRRYLKSSSYLADGKWHTIEIRQLSTIEHILEIIIDYCPQQIKTSECRFMIEYVEDDIFSTNEPLQLGGVANPEQLPIDYAGNFKGCIRNLRFADELYDLHVDSHSGQSLNLHEGCLLVDQKCSQLTCVHGTCEADLYHAQCICKPGKSGVTCAQDAQSYDFTYDKLTWTGDRASYATFRHTHKPDDYIHAMKFQIMFRTRDSSDRILTLIDLHNDDTFMFLELKSGHLQARFGSKSDAQLIELRYVEVNDGRWHTAYLDRYGQRLFLKLDDGEYYRSNISYGKSIWKNFPNTLLNVGARIDSVS